MKQGAMFGYIGNGESENKKNRSKVVKEETVWASFRNVEMVALCDSTHTSSIVESMDWTQFQICHSIGNMKISVTRNQFPLRHSIPSL